MDRPLPRNWKDRLRERVSAHTQSIKVVPKGVRSSGPHPAGDTWHLPLSQAEMQAEADKLLDKRRCAGCGERVIIASGELVEGLWCGRCYGERERPPAA
jgi:ribosomal protein S27AE